MLRVEMGSATTALVVRRGGPSGGGGGTGFRDPVCFAECVLPGIELSTPFPRLLQPEAAYQRR